jgi:hypothetical protein
MWNQVPRPGPVPAGAVGPVPGPPGRQAMVRPPAGGFAAGAQPDRPPAPRGEFSRGRIWLVATLCGLVGLSLVLVALSVADKRVAVLAPLLGGAPPTTTQAAPPPPAPPVLQTPAAEPAPAKSARPAPPAQPVRKPRARDTAPQASDDGSSREDSDSGDDSYESDGQPGYGRPGYGQDPQWGQYDQSQQLAQDMMRHRMNDGRPERHHR